MKCGLKQKEKKKKRKEGRERERERLREIEIEKTLGWVKDSGEVWKYKEYSLLVIAFFLFCFLLLLCIFIKKVKWFVTSVLISERLIFSKLDFKAL